MKWPPGLQLAKYLRGDIYGILEAADLLYHKTSYISHTLVGNEIVDNTDVVGASPVGAAPTTSSFST